jgi:chromosome segregation ATPase
VPGALQQRANLQRLDALDQKVQQLTAENAELKQKLASLERSSTSSAAALGQTNAAALYATLEPQLADFSQQLAAVTERLEQQQATVQAAAAAAEQYRSFLSAMGVQDVASARGQARMWDSTEAVAGLQEQLRQTRAELAAVEQKYEAQQVTSGQLHSAVQALQQQLDKQGGTVTVVAHAPADMHPDQLIDCLSRCGGIATQQQR